MVELCREHQPTSQMVGNWKQQFLAAAPQVFEQGSADNEEQARIAELERMVGRLTMELEIAKKSLQLAGWDAAQKRTAAMTMQADYPVKTICEVLDLPRSSFYHRASEGDDPDLRDALLDLAGQYPTYGYRRLTALLKRAGWSVNHKRIQRMMAQMGLQRPVKRRKMRTSDSQHDFPRYPNRVGGLEISRPHQVWVADITYIRLERDFVYLAVIMDVHTRAVRGWHLSRSLERELTLMALRRALADRVPDIHHSNQGVQYACGDYTDLLREHGVQISMAAVGKPEDNGYAERLMRTIKEEEVDLSEYEDFHDAYRSIGRLLDELYTQKRIHSALGYLTPAEYEADWLTRQPEPVLAQAQALLCPAFGGHYKDLQ